MFWSYIVFVVNSHETKNFWVFFWTTEIIFLCHKNITHRLCIFIILRAFIKKFKKSFNYHNIRIFNVSIFTTFNYDWTLVVFCRNIYLFTYKLYTRLHLNLILLLRWYIVECHHKPSEMSITARLHIRIKK